MSEARVLGVPIEGWGWDQIEEHLTGKGGGLWIVTANPEILLGARRDYAYRETLKRADLRTVDGTGLFFAMLVLRRKVARLTGIKLSEHLLQHAWKNHLRVGLLGGEYGAAEEAANHIRIAYPGLDLLVEQGGKVSRDGMEDGATEEARYRMTIFSPQILLVAFGHPRQERWIELHRNEFPALKVVVGVGGTFNYWAGFVKSPPVWMKTLGLEWLWRLIQEPSRIGRIWHAVVVFPVLFLIDRIQPTR